MSQKQLEKQNEKLEKQNKKLKKKTKKGGVIILILLLIILILFAIIFLFDPLGFGNGMGILKGGNASGTTGGTAAPAQTTTAAQVTDAAPAPTYINVKVSGATYLLDGAESTVEDITAAAKAASGDVLVQITDDSATANAMDALIAALDKESLKYTIENN